MTKQEIRTRLNALVDSHLDYCKSVVTGNGPMAHNDPATAAAALERINAEIRGINAAATALGCEIGRLTADETIIKLWRDNPNIIRR